MDEKEKKIEEIQRKHFAGNWLDEILVDVINKESRKPTLSCIKPSYFGHRFKKVLSRGFYYGLADHLQNDPNYSSKPIFEPYMKAYPDMKEKLANAASYLPKIVELERELFDETEEVSRLNQPVGGFFYKKDMILQRKHAEAAAEKFDELNRYLTVSQMTEVMYMINKVYFLPFYRDYHEYSTGKQPSMKYNMCDFLTGAISLGIEFAQKYRIGGDKFFPHPTDNK